MPRLGSLQLDPIQNALYDWVRRTISGLIPDENIVWRQQGQAFPLRPCVTLKIIDGPRNVGRSGNLSEGAGTKFGVGVQAVMTISVQVFGSTRIHRPMAYQSVIELHSSTMDPEVLSRLSRAGISVQDRGDPVNLTELVETEYEERAGFDLLIGVAQNIVSDPGTIQTVNVAGTVSGKPVTKTVTST